MAPMETRSVRNAAFRIRRPLTNGAGLAAPVDREVEAHLQELEEVLSRRVFDRDVDRMADLADDDGEVRFRGSLLAVTLGRELTPKRALAKGKWAEGSIVETLLADQESNAELTLSEMIDLVPELSELKYELETSLTDDWNELDYNTKAILADERPAVRDYLLAVGYFVMGLREVNGIKNFLVNNGRGVRAVVDYAAVSAARTVIQREQLIVNKYNDDDSEIVVAIRAARLPLSAPTFAAKLEALVDDFVFNSRELAIIESAEAKIGTIPNAIKPQLVQYIRSSPVPIDNTNSSYFLPLFITQIAGSPVHDRPEAPVTAEREFGVRFLVDDRAPLEASRSAVLCAAQLYYTMVVGDELRVFDLVAYFTHKTLVREQIEIGDRTLLNDLRGYVFSNEFAAVDPDTNRRKPVAERSRPAERQMFYRQVFNSGGGEITEDIVVNDEFPRLWKVLILESAKYLQRAQSSPHPDSFVSPQAVMQAVEDLQYNLSVHCSGMAKVLAPLLYDELDFVSHQILSHREITAHLAPQMVSRATEDGPKAKAFWKVVERLHTDMLGSRPRANAFNNKAMLGYEIIRAIADYDPLSFADDAVFADFISKVDAFIITQSILQESLTDQLKDAEREPREHKLQLTPPGTPGSEMIDLVNGSAGVGASVNGSSNNGAAADEWDF